METSETPKMEKNNIQESKEMNTVENIDKDKTFNRLKEIQGLLKKESSLNELCK